MGATFDDMLCREGQGALILLSGYSGEIIPHKEAEKGS